ncbi:NmrA family NAD(P)-binding protein [Methylobacterium sp. J-077]|uniref:NmrA family NAD(P)-binding protein n=1 Tax=Methylobacterium sp. J-077 TaxID=2836656 RepID=UPI001FBA967C|nr:NmrA family NAD(P)-binding protein [Methylobacterium sp. J-077]MCJ2122688.1 NmrA family NAD(P)-binding protein [Methylobacterium sp. J-077]
MSPDPVTVAVAGATGDLGLRIVRALRREGAAVTALVRPGTDRARIAPLTALGARVVEAGPGRPGSWQSACAGAACVVSAVNGLSATVIDVQTALLEGAVRAGVPRFIPSDFSIDYARTAPGGNRNLDLRRAFRARLDAAPIQATSVLSGAFMELLDGQAPLILHRPRRVLHWGRADQILDFTTKDDTAAFTARAALDPETPRWLRIAGESLSARDLAEAASAARGARYRTLRAGGLGSLGLMIRVARTLAPGRGAVFPAWQGMQYLRDMFEGRARLTPLDTDRYPGLRWTRVQSFLAETAGPRGRG